MQLSEFEHRLIHVLHEIAYWLRVLAGKHQTTLPSGGTITQLGENGMPRTDGKIQAGTSDVFQATFSPAGSVVPAADKISFASDDPSAVLSADPGGDPTKVVVAVPASDLQGSAPAGSPGSLNLACTVSGPDFPTPLKLTPLNVPIVAPVASNLPTGGTLSEIS